MLLRSCFQALHDLRCASSMLGSLTSIFWKRRTSGAVLLEDAGGTPCRWSSRCTGSCPRPEPASAGLRHPSRRPTWHPAPITVWISSMNSIAPRILFELLDDLLQPLLEIAAIAGAGKQRAHVERKDRGASASASATLPSTILLGQTFGNRGLADARVADVAAGLFFERRHSTWIVTARLRPDATDQRIDLAVLGLLVEVDAVGLQQRPAASCCYFLGSPRASARVRIRLSSAPRGVRVSEEPGRFLPMPCDDIVDRVVARHVLLLQEDRQHGFPAR
jgi:hypothetical protein